MSRSRTSKLEVGAGLLRTEITLVRGVSAIVFTVAFPHIRNTTTVRTGKLSCAAGHISAIEFIRVVATVIFLVTAEIQRYAAP